MSSHIFKHLQNSEHCGALSSAHGCHVSDHATTSFQLKIKEAIHFQREQRICESSMSIPASLNSQPPVQKSNSCARAKT